MLNIKKYKGKFYIHEKKSQERYFDIPPYLLRISIDCPTLYIQ